MRIIKKNHAVRIEALMGAVQESFHFRPSYRKNLRQHVTPQSGILVIYDRSQAIEAVLGEENGGWIPP
ncbi:hypothetical protein PIB30_053250 [Stylosanthes scabra]|uniref:Uncharacterized protein n=1 Tax=Stylosanthes scabra TaxID=79078 RepID=A0ABU6YIM1_9FABA|nr:hypothetical protein [Stylosanthes scabra]